MLRYTNRAYDLHTYVGLKCKEVSSEKYEEKYGVKQKTDDAALKSLVFENRRLKLELENKKLKEELKK